ncbi:MAG: hypothetical protein QG656_1998, partial [Candidatus Hydrogenedentes bacterium]|nr:hypothetical protein [Candidatus Hydrogenedentota bacterium]
ESGFWLWMLRPGMVLVTLGILAGLAAAWLALMPLHTLRYAVPAAVLAVILAAVGILTDFGQFSKPQPALEIASALENDGSGQVYRTAITVKNDGDAPLRLARGAVPKTYSYTVERQVQPGVWGDVSVPTEIHLGDGTSVPAVKEYVVAPADSIVFTSILVPGTYRVRLRPFWPPENAIVAEFELAAPPPPEPAPIVNPAPPPPEPPKPLPKPDAPPKPSGVLLELRGSITAEGREPRFSLTLTMPGQQPQPLVLDLGETIHEGWRLQEYNPDRQTLTLSRNGKLLVLSRGEPMDLPARESEPPQPPAEPSTPETPTP